jgi:hypothetical protein
MAEETYLSAESWAQIVATSWLDADFKDLLEKDPVAAVTEQFPNFKFSKILFINDNPGYSAEELQKIIEGTIAVVPRSGIPFTHGKR